MAATVDQLEAQIAMIADLVKAMRSGQWTGPGSVDAIYCALKGGLSEPDYEPLWPSPKA